MIVRGQFTPGNYQGQLPTDYSYPDNFPLDNSHPFESYPSPFHEGIVGGQVVPEGILLGWTLSCWELSHGGCRRKECPVGNFLVGNRPDVGSCLVVHHDSITA